MTQLDWKYHLKYSTYITAVWNWFLCFAGKAAEPVLFASVLFSGYELVPGIPQPSPLTNAYAFVIQQAALDVGGMNLVKISKRDSFGHQVGIVLIGLMILNTAVSATAKCFPLPTTVLLVIENLLLIVRSVMAVLFGYAIRSIGHLDSLPATQASLPSPLSVVQESQEPTSLWDRPRDEVASHEEQPKVDAYPRSPTSPSHSIVRDQAENSAYTSDQLDAYFAVPTTDPLPVVYREEDPRDFCRDSGTHSDDQSILVVTQTSYREAIKAAMASGESKSYADIASQLGCSLATVKKHGPSVKAELGL